MKPALACAAAVALLVFACANHSAAQAAASVQLTTVPDSVEISADGDRVPVLVVVRNGTDAAATEVMVQWLGIPTLEIRPDGNPTCAVNGAVQPGNDCIWPFLVTQRGADVIAGKLFVRVDYRSGTTRQTKSASLEVKKRAPVLADQLAEVSVRSTLTSLNEYRGGTVHLLLKNKSERQVTVTEVKPHVPGFVELTLALPKGGLAIPPMSTRTLPVGIAVREGEGITPGKQLLLFELALTWPSYGGPASGSLIASHEIEAAAFGESALLSLVAVPSLLVLPGALVLLTTFIIWGAGKTKEQRQTFPLPVVSAEFWTVAITISLVVAFAYPWITARTAWGPRNFLQSYALEDIAVVWLASVLAPTVVYPIVRFGPTWYRALLTRFFIPAPGDSVRTVLWKLRNQRLPLARERVDVTIEGTKQQGYLLERLHPDKATLAVGSPAQVTWVKKESALQTQVSLQLGPDGSPGELFRLLTMGERQRELDAKWVGAGKLEGVRRVPQADLRYVDKPADIFVVEAAPE